MSAERDDVSHWLQEHRDGNPEAIDRIVTLLYSELRRVAARALRGERDGHSLDPTALVHEAYLRIAGGRGLSWNDRAHFLGFAARVIRNVLVDQARARRRDKRAGDRLRVTFTDRKVGARGPDLDLVDLDEALDEFARLDPQKARIVELRYFGGLSLEETAVVLGVSDRTVKRGWTMAREWLRERLAGEE